MKKAQVILNNELQILSQFGQYLYQLRAQRRLSLIQLGARLGINASYLSEIERGLKMPQDELVSRIAIFFGLDENGLFEMLGKVPLSVLQEIEQNLLLQATLKEMSESQFSRQRKQELYGEFYNLVQRTKNNFRATPLKVVQVAE